MNKRRKIITVFAISLASVSILLLLVALLSWRSDGNVFGVLFPRSDLAYIGFAVVGIIYLTSAFGMYMTLYNKNAMIDDSDERNTMIQAVSGLYAYGVQTLLLFSCLFLMYFSGYMNGPSAVSLGGILLISIAVFVITYLNLRKKM